MRITLDWTHIVALLGAAQGFVLAGVLAVRQRNRTANRVLAVAVAAFSVYLTQSLYYATGLVLVFPHLLAVAYPAPFLFGPLIYLYAASASDRSRRLTRWDGLHLVPFLLAIAAMLPVYSMGGAGKVAFYQALLRGERPLVMHVIDALKLLSGISYCTVTLLFLRRHRASIEDNYSSLEQVNLRWLVRLTLATGAVWVLAVAMKLTQILHLMAYGPGDDFITLAVALLVYGIGHMALRQAEIFRFNTAEYAVVTAAAGVTATPDGPLTTPAVALESPGQTGPDEPRYERSGLSDREAAVLKSALLSTMDQDRPWQESALTLADLARRLSTTPHKLSELLNSQLRQSFYDFVNGYRVRYVQRRIGDEDARSLKILSLALDAGFASKSTFNDAFKKHTGKTPSAYRRSVAT